MIFGWMAAVFALAYFLPLSNPKITTALQEAFKLLQWYARNHTLACVVPALFIAGTRDPVIAGKRGEIQDGRGGSEQHGREHRVVPRGHVKLLLFEPAQIEHTGKVRADITKDRFDRLDV